MSPIAHNMLPEPTYYEGFWWDRTVKLDGVRPFKGRDYDYGLALECAGEYSNRVVTGNLSTLRRFLETSMRRSDRPELYLMSVTDHLIKKEKKDDFRKKLKYLDAYVIRNWSRLHEIAKSNLDKAVKIVLGVTRKRDYLCSAWADDDSLWTPKLQIGGSTPGQ